uniref:Uncharacterized protein n=1 Tax=virus sp. ct6zJ3 TaxID=2826792 RepID=A0A8S5R918_9VIRU|nr:MAG TPA: hypothetical protein [virus sp. ct6zJ3]
MSATLYVGYLSGIVTFLSLFFNQPPAKPCCVWAGRVGQGNFR